MKTRWQDQGETRQVSSPVSLIVSAFAPIADVREVLTPMLCLDQGPSVLILVDLAQGQQRLAASALAQVFQQLGEQVPDVDDPGVLRRFHAAMLALRAGRHVLAYHDRSDGGLLACVLEMAFAARCGLALNIDLLTIDPHVADWGDFKIKAEQVRVQRNEASLRALFNEELGVVLQVRLSERDQVMQILREHGLSQHSHVIGKPVATPQGEPWTRARVNIDRDGRSIFRQTLVELLETWQSCSQAIASLRDEPNRVAEDYRSSLDADTTGLFARLTFPVEPHAVAFEAPIQQAPSVGRGARPRLAILREQGVNGHFEMAAAFDRAGFECHDLHMSDLLTTGRGLDGFHGLAACGGFSYGDVLGAGSGWAKSILFNAKLAEMFSEFFHRDDTFGLGVCNGCQMMSQLKSLIPGAEHWPEFLRNTSEQYEARLVLVEVQDSPSIFLQGMQGSVMPIVVSHGEGRATFASEEHRLTARAALRYVDHQGLVTQCYPFNPNGSMGAVAGVCNQDGRFTIMMPHPERVFRSVQMSWAPESWGEDSAWMQIFRNARRTIA